MAYLWVPLTTGGYYLGADLLQSSELLRVAPPDFQCQNGLVSDTVTQMVPCLKFNRGELAKGRLPVWNPYNGYGAPHLANLQSAVFSIYSAPFYVLSFRFALIVAAVMKLFGLGFFTYLFLKRVGASHLPALIGGTAFMFSGHNVLWLNYPMPASTITLPAGIYFAELALSAGRARCTVDAGSSLIGFSLANGIGFFAGHIEA